jgi:hypothetical protein
MNTGALAASAPVAACTTLHWRQQRLPQQEIQALAIFPPAPPPQHYAAPELSQQPQQQRRQVVASMLGLAASCVWPLDAAAATERATSDAVTASAIGLGAAKPKNGSIAARLLTEGSIQQPGIMPPWSPKQIYFPRWLFGEWEVRSADWRASAQGRRRPALLTTRLHNLAPRCWSAGVVGPSVERCTLGSRAAAGAPCTSIRLPAAAAASDGGGALQALVLLPLGAPPFSPSHLRSDAGAATTATATAGGDGVYRAEAAAWPQVCA